MESGGHRWQRVPPTERRGRVHTSTVTVAVLEPLAEGDWLLDDREIEVIITRDRGPGGQHRNTTDSAVLMRHRPSGLTAKAAAKSQHQNRRTARAQLERRVAEHYRDQSVERSNQKRRQLVGSGMRGDKVRTYRVRDDQVTDHRTQRRARLKKIMSGDLADLF